MATAATPTPAHRMLPRPRVLAPEGEAGAAEGGTGEIGTAAAETAETAAVGEGTAEAGATATVAPLADGQVDVLLIVAAGNAPLGIGRWSDPRSRFTRRRSARMSAALW